MIGKCVCGCGEKLTLQDGRGRIRKYIHGHNKTNLTHGLTNSPEFSAWLEMKRRCYDVKRHNYKYYGGRGIKVCARWKNSFDKFYADMGIKPGKEYSIDRINNDLDYSPENCKWATKREQALNRRPRGTANAI